MGRRRNGARTRGYQQVSARAVCGFTLAGSRYDGRRSRARARPALTGRPCRVPLARRSTPRRAPKGARRYGQHIGRTSDSDSGVPASDDENVRGRRDSV